MVVVIVIGIRGERQVVVVVTVIMYWRVIHVPGYESIPFCEAN